MPCALAIFELVRAALIKPPASFRHRCGGLVIPEISRPQSFSPYGDDGDGGSFGNDPALHRPEDFVAKDDTVRPSGAGGSELIDAERQSVKPNLWMLIGLARRSVDSTNAAGTVVTLSGFSAWVESSSSSTSSSGRFCHLSRKATSFNAKERFPSASAPPPTSKQSNSTRTSPVQWSFRHAPLNSLNDTVPLLSSSSCLNAWLIEPKCSSAQSLNEFKMPKLSKSYSFMVTTPDRSSSSTRHTAAVFPSNLIRLHASLNSTQEIMFESSRSSKARQARNKWP
mmetsp:Transcript_9072/g.27176  ORF Transcript_9072/g.27176 Transcript_9072/m.27176 type:complete len:282 (-) Transcript_9072:1410-2255(-)